MSDDDTFIISTDLYQFWMVDYVNEKISIVMQDGTTHTETLDNSEVIDNSPIARSIFDWEKWWVHLHTTRNDLVIWLGFNPDTGEPRPQRPTVYLDQNKWSLVATALVAPERVVDPAELAAALQLAEWASDDGIILPLSSAHLLETSALYGDKRYAIGLTIANLSNGWQMRHPIDVLQHEAADALGEQLDLTPISSHTARGVITTEPAAWQAKESFGLGLPPTSEIETFMAMLRAPAVAVALLIEPERLVRDSSTTWVEHHQKISNQIHQLGGTKEARRATALRRYWNENLGFYRQALQAVYNFTNVPMFSDRDLRELLGRTRMTSLLSQLFVQRFLDHQTQWQRNDLVDMLFLTCAAGHCDYVVAENRTGKQLGQIQRSRNSPVTVFTTLAALVDELDRAGVTTDTQRRAAGLAQ